jgi:hypothetical protein
MWACFSSLAVAFGFYIYFGYQPDAAYYNEPDNLNAQATIQFATGYLLETALAFDNIFVIGMVFTFFAVPREYQHRVLFWGIIGAIVFRAIFISLGAAIVNEFTWVLYIFAAFLLYTGGKMLLSGSGDDDHMDLNDNPVLKFLKKRMRVTDTIENHRFAVSPIASPLLAAGNASLVNSVSTASSGLMSMFTVNAPATAANPAAIPASGCRPRLRNAIPANGISTRYPASAATLDKIPTNTMMYVIAHGGATTTSLRINALTSPASSATPAPIIAAIKSPTAVKLMKFGIIELYRNRTPSADHKLRTDCVTCSNFPVVSLYCSNVALTPISDSTCATAIVPKINSKN